MRSGKKSAALQKSAAVPERSSSGARFPAVAFGGGLVHQIRKTIAEGSPRTDGSVRMDGFVFRRIASIIRLTRILIEHSMYCICICIF